MDKHKIAEILRQNLQWVIDQEPIGSTSVQDRFERHITKHSLQFGYKLNITLTPDALHQNHLKASSYLLIMGEEEARALIKMVESL